MEIKDEITGKSSEAQYRKLKALKGEFKLHELFKLDPSFTESDQITFVPVTDNALVIFNKSSYRIEKNGIALDGDTFHRFSRNDRVRILLKELNQSIIIKITSLES